MMSSISPTFVHEGNEILAFVDDKVIARGTNVAAVEGDAVKYLDSLSEQHKNTASEKAKSSATHIVTPNGVKGEILGQFEGQWGEKEITVRFENGRIAKFQAHGGNDEGIQYTTEETPKGDSFMEYFESKLAATTDGSVQSLTARIAELDLLISEAGAASRTASYGDAKAYDQIVLTARHEQRESREAIEHLKLADAEAFAPPAPFQYGVEVVHQASFGHSANDGWLDNAVQSMIEENEATDFGALLNEGPGQLVASLEDGPLADAGATREAALSHITSKTAGFQGPELDEYREKFLANTELARRQELLIRQNATQKEASQKEASVDGVPDDALFM